MAQISLHGVIDMHVHTNPDLRPRAYDDFELCDAAVRVGARAVVIKSHQGATADRAFLTNRYNLLRHGDRSFTMYGSITLNRCVGGIIPTRWKRRSDWAQKSFGSPRSPPAITWKRWGSPRIMRWML